MVGQTRVVEPQIERCFAAIESGDSYRVIPWQMGVVAKLMRMLPNSLYDKIFSGRSRKPRAGKKP